MWSLVPVRLLNQSDISYTCLSWSRTVLQNTLLHKHYLPITTSRLVSTKKSVEKTGGNDKGEKKKDKGTSNKYIYYKAGKPKYSTGEPLSIRHVSRISDKQFFGPLLETKKEKIKREKREEKTLLLQKNSIGYSSENLLERIQQNSKAKKKSARFDADEYDRVAAVYANMHYNTSRQVKKSTQTAIQKREKDLSCDTFHKNIEHSLDINDCNHEVFAPSASLATTSGAEKCLPLSAHLQTVQTSSKLDVISPALSTTPNLLEVDNNKYVDTPQYLDLQHLQTFPLFRSDTSPLQSPFHSCSSFNNSGDGIDMKSLRDELDTTMDSKPTDGITTIGYRTSGSKNLPSVSRILSETMPEASKIALAKWEAKMIAQLGEQGFQDYKKELFSQGSLLHECIHAFLQHSEPPSASALSRIEGFWRSVEPVVAEVRRGEDVVALESRVIHPHLHYAGVLDCVAIYRNTPVIVEWKTSTKPKRTLKATYDNPLQVAAYLGALQHDPAYRHVQVQSGLLAFAYGDGSSGDTHVLSRATLERYWRMWLARLAAFWKINSVTRTDETLIRRC